MEIPLQAQVECTDGVFGRSVHLLINPVKDQITHLVVRKHEIPHTEYIVPVTCVADTITGTIQLNCIKEDVEKMEPFMHTRFVETTIPDYETNRSDGLGTSYYWPFISPDIKILGVIKEEQIPWGETSVRRGTRVEATDGLVGHVDEFVVDAESDCITHLVMREGHLWGQKDVIIPVSALENIREDSVSLKLDKRQIEALPNFPVHRRWS